MSVRVGLLAGHPEVFRPLAAAYQREWPQWYGVHGDAMTDLTDRSRHSRLPIGLVAVEGGTIVGALAIAERSVSSHAHLSPWVIGFWVEPARRNRGIGSQLLAGALSHRRREGFARLYAATAAASSLFAREGWTLIDTGTSDLGEKIGVFSKTLEL